MKKIIFLSVFLMGFFFISNSTGLPQNGSLLINKIRLLPEDIPQGFMYGVIPTPYKTTLKDNPWEFDKAAIEKLADKIYPGGDYRQISAIHVTIIARKDKPYYDDIVCYIIQFKTSKAARDEIKKMSDYASYNHDRAILHVKDNLAVFLFADDVSNFLLLKELDKKIADRIEKS
ncbi:MAG: hypothetical protein V1874_15215 [Spirochaetota bacterium]